MRKKAALLLLIFALAISFISCADSTASAPSINRKLLPVSNGPGVTYGLYNMDGEIETTKHFEIGSGDVFEEIFSFGSMIDVERTYKLLVFANYAQVDFSVDNDPAAGSFDFTTAAQEHVQHTIKVSGLKDGFYDLLLLVVKDPYNDSLDEEYRKQTELSHMVSMRYSLQVGTEDGLTLDHDFKVYENVADTTLSRVFLNNQRDLMRLLVLDCNQADQPELYLHIGNSSAQSKNYASFLLYDWEQAPIGENDVLYSSVPSSSRMVLPFKLQTVGAKGVHNLTAVCVEAPYHKASIEDALPTISNRIGIKVS